MKSRIFEVHSDKVSGKANRMVQLPRGESNGMWVALLYDKRRAYE